MARMATRIASGLAAAGIATILSTAPAEARPAPDPAYHAAVTKPLPKPGTSWLTIALGAAGGIAIGGAGVATVSSRKRQPQRGRQTPVAG